MRPPIPWFGGKQLMSGRLLPLFPEHRTYVEVFGGAGALLFGKNPSAVEVYNDLDSDLVNWTGHPQTDTLLGCFLSLSFELCRALVTQI